MFDWSIHWLICCREMCVSLKSIINHLMMMLLLIVYAQAICERTGDSRDSIHITFPSMMYHISRNYNFRTGMRCVHLCWPCVNVNQVHKWWFYLGGGFDDNFIDCSTAIISDRWLFTQFLWTLHKGRAWPPSRSQCSILLLLFYIHHSYIR